MSNTIFLICRNAYEKNDIRKKQPRHFVIFSKRQNVYASEFTGVLSVTGGTSHIQKNYLIPTHERKHTPESRKDSHYIPIRMIPTASTKRQGTNKIKK